MIDTPKILIYGAYGYTGELVVAEAVRRGLRPVLSGRRSQQVTALANRHDLPARPFALSDPAAVAARLDDIDTVLHCAGPYSQTFEVMVQACLASGTNYLDLTGEIDVFTAIYAHHGDAVAAGVALIPGVGFDIVPTDNLVARLVRMVPDSIGADVAVISRGGFSRGTLRTAVAGIAEGNRIRANSAITLVPHAHRVVTPDLGKPEPVLVATTPLGDVASVHHGYGLAEVATFTKIPFPRATRRVGHHLQLALGTRAGQRVANKIIDHIPVPGDATRDRTRSTAWANVYRADGSGLALAVDVANTYTFTAASMVHAAVMLHHSGARPGAFTPATVLGTDFLESIPRAEVSWVFGEPQPTRTHDVAKRPLATSADQH